jgi:hypothetical protein
VGTQLGSTLWIGSSIIRPALYSRKEFPTNQPTMPSAKKKDEKRVPLGVCNLSVQNNIQNVCISSHGPKCVWDY